jgi:hypothetical protein
VQTIVLPSERTRLPKDATIHRAAQHADEHLHELWDFIRRAASSSLLSDVPFHFQKPTTFSEIQITLLVFVLCSAPPALSPFARATQI